ncbi:MAG: hypothetical protein KF870_07405 [Leadbetterella sp.]|nr:hypothetical protein [Leadbetterella sp.]
MKHLTLLLFLISLSASAQDKIKFIDGRTLETKIIEVSTKEVKYKMFNYLDGPTHVTSKKEISEIEYQNGDKDNFNLTDKEIESKKAKFTRHIEVGALPGVGHYYNEYMGTSAIPGVTFNNRLFIGFGVGFYYTYLLTDYYAHRKDFSNIEALTMPFYLNTQLYITKTKVSPFLNLSAGLNYINADGINYSHPFGEAGLGINGQLKRNLGLYLIGGWNVYNYKYTRHSDATIFGISEKTEPLSAISVRLGFKF